MSVSRLRLQEFISYPVLSGFSYTVVLCLIINAKKTFATKKTNVAILQQTVR